MADEERIDTALPEATDAPSISPDRGSDNDGRSERRSLREELQNSFTEAQKSDAERDARGDKRDQFGRFIEGSIPPPRKPKVEAPAPAVETQPQETADPALESTETAETEPTRAPESTAPIGWAKEAKAEWAQLSPTIQAAVLKREQDTQKGVDELKQRYSDIDKSLSPHLEAIRRHGHSPAQAVSQLFSWFEALAQNPDQAFPALAKSFNYDPAKLAGTSSAPAATPAQPSQDAGQPTQEPSQATPDVIPPQLQSVIDQITQKVTGLESTFQQQSEAKTQEVLNLWSKDKEFFADVRGNMAQLISSGAVPLKDGRVDLDGAYEAAIWMNPDVRNKVMAKQQAEQEAKLEAQLEKKQRAQQEAANKARRAAVSLAPAAPSANVGKGAPKKGKSVRDSLKEAIDEVSA